MKTHRNEVDVAHIMVEFVAVPMAAPLAATVAPARVVDVIKYGEPPSSPILSPKGAMMILATQ